MVKVTAERFAVEIEQALTEQGDTEIIPRVFCVQIKGHAALFFLPQSTNTDDKNGGKRHGSGSVSLSLPIYTTGKVNAWKKREKAPRDIYGQIIPKIDSDNE